jgi:hypothetical protein
VATWLDSLADASLQLVPDACEDYGRTVPSSLSALEAALAELMDLLDAPSRPESYYQNWFEEHPVVFEALGYEEVLPQPVLRRDGRPNLKPDFICRRPSGLWEVVELKLPNQRIVRTNLRYPIFYADVSRHIGQCRAYIEYFTEQANRTRVGEEHGIDVQSQVPVVLVIGQLERDDPRQIAHQLSEERNISILPYDELSASLELHRTQIANHEEGGRGFAVQLVLAIREMEHQPNLILDVSVDIGRDRLTLLMEPEGDLRLRLMDHQGMTHWVSASMQELGVEYDRSGPRLVPPICQRRLGQDPVLC